MRRSAVVPKNAFKSMRKFCGGYFAAVAVVPNKYTKTISYKLRRLRRYNPPIPPTRVSDPFWGSVPLKTGI